MKLHTSMRGGGKLVAKMPPPPLPRSIVQGVKYFVLSEFSALKMNK